MVFPPNLLALSNHAEAHKVKAGRYYISGCRSSFVATFPHSSADAFPN